MVLKTDPVARCASPRRLARSVVPSFLSPRGNRCPGRSTTISGRSSSRIERSEGNGTVAPPVRRDARHHARGSPRCPPVAPRRALTSLRSSDRQGPQRADRVRCREGGRDAGRRGHVSAFIDRRDELPLRDGEADRDGAWEASSTQRHENRARAGEEKLLNLRREGRHPTANHRPEVGVLGDAPPERTVPGG